MAIPLLNHPIVLVHGLLGFDQVALHGWTLASYFQEIPHFVREAGNQVLVPQLNPLGSIEERATQLKMFLDRECPAKQVHLIAHSMGGLDSRFMISRLGMASRVLTLTTIATPHRGTAFADWGVRRLGPVLRPFFHFFNVPSQAFYDLTTEKCKEFNETVPDAPEVRYFSVAGRHEGDWLFPEWQLPHKIVFDKEGHNDGVVSVTSATYGEKTEVWEGDHVSLVAWHNPLTYFRGRKQERIESYAALLGRLEKTIDRTRT